MKNLAIIGNTTKDSVTLNKGGKDYTFSTVAVSGKNETYFFDITVNGTMEIKKGTKVYCYGDYTPSNTYNGKIFCNQLVFCSKKESEV